MEDSGAPVVVAKELPTTEMPTRKKRKRVSVFSVGWRLLVALLILGGGAYIAYNMVTNRPEPPERQARERSFTVAVTSPEVGTFRPNLQAFGEIVAGRTIEMRAQVSGEVLEISPNLQAGGKVAAGELIARIDSFSYDGAVRDAEAALADARLQLTVAEEQLRLELINLEAAKAQLDLGRRDLERAQALLSSGSITEKVIEDRELLVSQREQTVAQRQSSANVQQSAIDRQAKAIIRAEWSLEQAERALENTSIYAPFNGVVMSANISLGRIISNNEIIAQLYEQEALEARFTLSDQGYGQLLSDGLVGRPVTAIWDIEPDVLEFGGEIDRVGAQVDAALGGVEIFARLAGEGTTNLRPGTFVEMRIDGRAYENALLLPETAIYENDHLYIVKDRRMSRVDVELLARNGSNAIIRAELEPTDRVILTRVAQAGDGLLVTIEGEASEGRPGGGQPDSAAENAESAAPAESEARPAEAGQQRGTGGGRPSAAEGAESATPADGEARPVEAGQRRGAGQGRSQQPASTDADQ